MLNKATELTDSVKGLVGSFFIMVFLKYRNSKVENEHGKFDSKKEYARFLELSEMEERGEISQLCRQVKYELIPKQQKPVFKKMRNGKEKVTYKTIEKPCCYVADYVYFKGEELVVEDVKSAITRNNASYKIKRKLMLWIHGVKIHEV